MATAAIESLATTANLFDTFTSTTFTHIAKNIATTNSTNLTFFTTKAIDSKLQESTS